ncbi:hypothetical protein D9611_001197 [Ephemerocybe angulata]|uniref:Maf-like protein n=1 Tax=Ephemerocybe angulata TaxID=980116 RepID=A0A8H5FM49_9AGAR|nr:hypothetical protein D9611_001197 [Tulosesus angulatus]
MGQQSILSTALKTPVLEKLKGKRIVLASASPRRKEILRLIGIDPEIVPSTFEEDLSPSSFADIHEYPVATATQKAVEVYEKLVAEDPDNAPDLVIAADTVVLTHPQPLSSTISYTLQPGIHQELLEKPGTKKENLRMLLDLNGNVCEVVTGVVVAFPVLQSPGYKIQSIDERSLVYFADCKKELVEAYVESGEGIDRAGGFAVQGLGSVLVRKIEGDYHNVVGFPVASFYKLLEMLVEEDEDFLDI